MCRHFIGYSSAIKIFSFSAFFRRVLHILPFFTILWLLSMHLFSVDVQDVASLRNATPEWLKWRWSLGHVDGNDPSRLSEMAWLRKASIYRRSLHRLASSSRSSFKHPWAKNFIKVLQTAYLHDAWPSLELTFEFSRSFRGHVEAINFSCICI